MAESSYASASQHHPVAKDVARRDKKSTDDVESTREDIAEDTVRVIDSAAERALCRKFDFRLLPVLALMVCLAITLLGGDEKR